jgi:hypothetical protein
MAIVLNSKRNSDLHPNAMITETIETIQDRSLPKGGFAPYRGGSFRPDATAWAVLALEAYGVNRNPTRMACRRLAQSQGTDGRVPVVESHPQSFWPTSLALFAWNKIPGFKQELNLAIKFLLSNRGQHQPKKENGMLGHDSSIEGWPWVENTHSWIEPTSLAVLALTACGYAQHERVSEAVRMILDRQLPSGGWNYGNTFVFGKELPPIPESTGHALCALAGFAEADEVGLSIDYLKREATRIRTPLALSWSLFGLTAWSRGPLQARDWILESLALQSKYGAYDTALLSQLIVAYVKSGDLSNLIF